MALHVLLQMINVSACCTNYVLLRVILLIFKRSKAVWQCLKLFLNKLLSFSINNDLETWKYTMDLNNEVYFFLLMMTGKSPGIFHTTAPVKDPGY